MFSFTTYITGIGNSPYPNSEDYGTSFSTAYTTYNTSFSNSNSTASEFQSGGGSIILRSEDSHSNQTTFISDTAGGKTQKTLISESSFFSNSSQRNGFGNGSDYQGQVTFAFGISGTSSGDHFILANTYLLSEGLYVSSFQSDNAIETRSSTSSASGTFLGTSFVNNYSVDTQGLTRGESYIEYYVYRGAETRYNNSYYYTSSYRVNNNGTTSSTYTTSSSAYITTISNTCIFSSYYTASTTNNDPFIPTIVTSITYTYTDRCLYSYYDTTITEDIFNPLTLSRSESTEFVYLTKTTEGSGSNAYLTITTSSSTAQYLVTYTTNGSYGKQLAYILSTNYYSDWGNTVTGIVTAGSNWAWGEIGGVLVSNGANQSLVNKFSNLSVITENTTIDPNLDYNKDSIELGTNNASFIFSYIQTSYIETTYAQIYYEETNQASYYFDSDAGSVASSIITYWDFPTTSQATGFVATTTLATGVCQSGSNTYTYVDSVTINALKTSTVLLGSISNTTNTIEYYGNSIETFVQTYVRLALTSTFTSFSSQGVTTASNSGESSSYGGSTYGDAYASYEFQYFNTATAKSFNHVGTQFNYGLRLLRSIHGNGAFADAIYLDTSISNKTNNTGYYIYSNNLSYDALPNPLSYNATSILDNGQLINYQEIADNQYYYIAGFASVNDDANPPPYIVTPISQSSYNWIIYAGSSTNSTTRITASYGGISDSASYTSIVGNGSTSSSSSGLISFYFENEAGTRLKYDFVTDNNFSYLGNYDMYKHGVGGKERLYTNVDTILPEFITAQLAYTLGDVILTSSVNHIYYQTDFLSSGTSSYSGSLLFAPTVVTNLKYIRLNNDSWIVADSIGGLGGVLLDAPTTVFSETVYNFATNRGINADFETYYGSTYLN